MVLVSFAGIRSVIWQCAAEGWPEGCFGRPFRLLPNASCLLPGIARHGDPQQIADPILLKLGLIIRAERLLRPSLKIQGLLTLPTVDLAVGPIRDRPRGVQRAQQ